MDAKEMREYAEEAKARADAATEGPWEAGQTPTGVDSGVSFGGDDVIYDASGERVLGAIGGEGALGDWGCLVAEKQDLEFIAAARTDVPTLADMVLELLPEEEAADQ